MPASAMRDEPMTGGPRVLRVASRSENATPPNQSSADDDMNVPASKAETASTADAPPVGFAPAPAALAAEPAERQVNGRKKKRQLPWPSIAMATAGLLGVVELGAWALPRLGVTLTFHPNAPSLSASLASASRAAAPPSGVQTPLLGPPKLAERPASQTTLPSITGRQAPAPPPAALAGPQGSPGQAAVSTPSALPAPSQQGAQVNPAAAGTALALPAKVSSGPAPLTPDEKIELQLAGKLAALSDQVINLDKRMSGMQQTLDDRVSSGIGTLGGRLDALQHRQDEMDRNLLQLAVTNASKVATQSATALPPAAAQTPAPPQVVGAERSPARSQRHARQNNAAAPVRPFYRVQAGAPDIAILQDGAGNASRVEPGSTIPGWGTVEAISAGDSGWIVKTSGGLIH